MPSVQLSAIDAAQLWVHVRHVYVFRNTTDLAFGEFASLLRDELHCCVAEDFALLTGVVGTPAEHGTEAAEQVLDVDVGKVAERVRVAFGTTLHSVTTAQLHSGDVKAALLDWESDAEESWTCAARISRCIIDGDDNGVAIGVGVSHRIADAASVGRFVVRWATRCRARLGREPSVPIPASYLEAPSFDKSSIPAFVASVKDSHSGEADAADPAPPGADVPPIEHLEECQTWRLRFRNDVLKRLQDSAEVRERGLPLSRNDFILAATSQAVTRAILAAGYADDTQGFTVAVPIDIRGRSRRSVPLPANYFGNGLVLGDRHFARLSEACVPSLLDTAVAIHRAIRAATDSDEAIAKKVSVMALNHDLCGGLPSGIALALSTWVHSGMHCVDFAGSGHVWASSVQNPPFPFLGFLVPSPGGAGIDIGMALPLSVATALRASVEESPAGEHIFTIEGRMA